MESPTRRVAGWLLRLQYATQGQDMIEYALMAALVAVSAGAVMPPVTGQISAIFAKIISLAQVATGSGAPPAN